MQKLQLSFSFATQPEATAWVDKTVIKLKGLGCTIVNSGTDEKPPGSNNGYVYFQLEEPKSVSLDDKGDVIWI